MTRKAVPLCGDPPTQLNIEAVRPEVKLVLRPQWRPNRQIVARSLSGP